MRLTCTLLLALTGTVASSCDSDTVDVSPTLSFNTPDTDISIEAGGLVTISYADNDPDSEAATDVIADLDGDPGTTADQISIAAQRLERDGVPQQISWDTSGVSAGRYSIFGRVSDDVNPPVTDVAVGRVEVTAVVSPTAEIRFPPPNSRFRAEESNPRNEITVSGRAYDAGGIASARVNGVTALSADGFATWQAVVPVQAGDNDLVVEVEDAVGNRAAAADRAVVRVVEPSQEFIYPSLVAPVPGEEKTIVAVRDGQAGQPRHLLAVDLLTGESTPLISTPSEYEYVLDLEVDAVRNRVVLLTKGPGPDAVLNVLVFDLAQETLSTLTTIEVDEISTIGRPYSLALGGPGNDIYVRERSTLLAVDPDTGQQSVVSSDTVGTGPSMFWWWTASGLALDSTQGRALVGKAAETTADTGGLVEVDLSTGNRSMLSSRQFHVVAYDAGTDAVLYGGWSVVALSLQDDSVDILSRIDPPRWYQDQPFHSFGVSDLALDASSRRVTSLASGTGAVSAHLMDTYAVLVHLDLESLQSNTVLSGAGRVALRITEATDVVLDGRRNRLLVLDRSHDVTGEPAISSIDLDTGNCVREFDLPFVPRAAALDPGGDNLYVVEESDARVWALDLASKTGTWIPGMGSGPPVDAIALVPGTSQGLLLHNDFLGDLCYPWARGAALVKVDLQTGDRVVVSDAALGGGMNFGNPLDMAMDPARDRIVCADKCRPVLMTVDLESGLRTSASGPYEGEGPSIFATTVDVDAANDRAILVGGDQMLAVDLATGNRSVVSSPTVGRGPVFSAEDRARVVVDSEKQLAYLLTKDAVLVVDLVSGDRVILSR